MIYFLLFVIALLLGVIGFLCWKIYIFAGIIMAFEDDIADGISALDGVGDALIGIIELKLFFDSQDIQLVVKEAMDSIKMAKFQIGKISKRFTDRSKHKYYIIKEEDGIEEQRAEMPELFNSLEQGRAIGNVERSKK